MGNRTRQTRWIAFGIEDRFPCVPKRSIGHRRGVAYAHAVSDRPHLAHCAGQTLPDTPNRTYTFASTLLQAGLRNWEPRSPWGALSPGPESPQELLPSITYARAARIIAANSYVVSLKRCAFAMIYINFVPLTSGTRGTGCGCPCVPALARIARPLQSM